MKRKREKVEGMGKKRKEKCDQKNEEDEKENEGKLCGGMEKKKKKR